MGVQIVKDNTDDFLRRVGDAVGGTGGGLDRATRFAASKVIASMPGPGAAAFDNDGDGRLETFIPSNPGTPPGVRIGILRNSITNARLGVLKWGFGTNVDYARPLEFGTVNMPARPFLRPALRNNREQIGKQFVAGFKAKMGGG